MKSQLAQSKHYNKVSFRFYVSDVDETNEDLVWPWITCLRQFDDGDGERAD